VLVKGEEGSDRRVANGSGRRHDEVQVRLQVLHPLFLERIVGLRAARESMSLDNKTRERETVCISS
jgi:hypothetical protein